MISSTSSTMLFNCSVSDADENRYVQSWFFVTCFTSISTCIPNLCYFASVILTSFIPFAVALPLFLFVGYHSLSTELRMQHRRRNAGRRVANKDSIKSLFCGPGSWISLYRPKNFITLGDHRCPYLTMSKCQNVHQPETIHPWVCVCAHSCICCCFCRSTLQDLLDRVSDLVSDCCECIGDNCLRCCCYCEPASPGWPDGFPFPSPRPSSAFSTTSRQSTPEIPTRDASRTFFSQFGNPLQGVSSLAVKRLAAADEGGDSIPDTLPLSTRQVHSTFTLLWLAGRHHRRCNALDAVRMETVSPVTAFGEIVAIQILWPIYTVHEVYIRQFTLFLVAFHVSWNLVWVSEGSTALGAFYWSWEWHKKLSSHCRTCEEMEQS